MSQLFQMDQYLIQTKFWRLFGGAFWFGVANVRLGEALASASDFERCKLWSSACPPPWTHPLLLALALSLSPLSYLLSQWLLFV